MNEADLNTGRMLNTDSTDYIYAKPNTVGRTFPPDYSDFDYVDIKGSSADVEQGFSSREHKQEYNSQTKPNQGVYTPPFYHYQQEKPKTMHQQMKETSNFKVFNEGASAVSSTEFSTFRYSQLD